MRNRLDRLWRKARRLWAKPTYALPFVLPQEVRGSLHQSVLTIERLAGDHHYSVALVGCQHGAGTTTLAWSLARTFADITEKSVVMVEANMHTPALAGLLNLRERPGFRELVEGSARMDEVVQQPAGERFSVVTAGDCAGDRSRTFSRSRLEQALASVREKFQMTIVDAPPLLIHPDTLSLAGCLDGLILVLRAGSDEWEVAGAARNAVSDTSAEVLGAILNRQRSYLPEWLS